MPTKRKHRAHPALRDLQVLADDAITRSSEHDERIAVLWEASRIEHAARKAVQLLVDDARDAGATWADIGEYFGVTRQAAQQRYGYGLPRA